MNNRPYYRIRGSRKTEDPFEEQIEEHLKLSTHLKEPKRANSHSRFRKTNESRVKSNLAHSRPSSGVGNMVNSTVGKVLRRSRNQKNPVSDIEFKSVKYISIVSIYDPKRLCHITASDNSLKDYFSKYGSAIKKDPMSYFKDIRKHFQSWLNKINDNYSMVLSHFLNMSGKSPLKSLEDVGPVLQQIRQDTKMMKQKIQGCLSIYEIHDLKILVNRFQGFFVFSKGLEDLIGVIYQSKQRIDQLFMQLERNDNMDKKVQRIRKQGVKQAKKLVYEEADYSPNLCQRLVEKVNLAINDMAQKSLNVFHKIQGAKHLLQRLSIVLNDSNKGGLTLSKIQTLSKIFKQIIEQAKIFDEFANKFNIQEGQLISPELKEMIWKYQQNIQNKKKVVSEVQLIFVSTIINETIQTLKHNYTINNLLQQPKGQYHQFNHILQEIAETMLDSTKYGIVDGLAKFGRTSFTRLEEVLERVKKTLRRNQQGIVIDTEQGLITIDCFVKQIKDYKDKIKNLIKRHEDSLRTLDIKVKEVKLPSVNNDEEVAYLIKLSELVQVINGRERKQKIINQKGLQQIKGGISTLGQQAEHTYFLIQELLDSFNMIKQLNQQNPIKNLIKLIYLENSLYMQSSYIINILECCKQTTQKNLIQQISKLNEANSKRKHDLEKDRHYQITKTYQYLLERLYCFMLLKGFKKSVIKQMDQNTIAFPENQYQTKQMENQIKYRNLIVESLGQGCNFAKNKIKNTIHIMSDLVSSYRIVQKLRKNDNGQFVVQVQILANLCQKMFKLSIIDDSDDRDTECKKIALQLWKILKNKLSSIDLLDSGVDMKNNEAMLRVRKQILHYQKINKNAIQINEELSKSKNLDLLQMYSTFVFTLSQYIIQSKQIAYIALNQFKQPIWIGPPEQSVTGIAKEINIQGYTRGSYVEELNRQPPKIRPIDTKAKPSPDPKQKQASPSKGHANIKIKINNHPKDMDEQIMVESDEQMKDQIQKQEIDQINDAIEDQMGQDIEDMGEEIEEIGEEAEQQINGHISDNSMGEEIEEISKPANKNNIQNIPVKKIQEKQEPKPPQKATVSDFKKSIYEIIPHFKELSSIQQFFNLIKNSQQLFWSSEVDFSQVQDYFHRPKDAKERSNFIKALENSFNQYIQKTFVGKLADEIKQLERIKLLKINLSDLGQKNWPTLFKILQLIELSYSLLFKKQGDQQIIQIYIANRNQKHFKKQGIKKCIDNYLLRLFKSTYYLPALFDLDSYVNFCFKQDTKQMFNKNGKQCHYIYKIFCKFPAALPTSNTHTELTNLEQLGHKFTQQFVTGIDLYHFCLQLWLKAISPQEQDHYKPNYTILKNYTTKFDSLQKKEWICHYLTEFNKEINTVKAQVKSLKNNIQNILFKIDNSNIFQCISQTAELFKKVITKQTYSLGNNKQEKLIFLQSKQQVMDYYSQSELLNALQRCLSRKNDATSKIVIKTSEFVLQIEKLFAQNKLKVLDLDKLSQFLNIFELNHYFITSPNFLLKQKIEDVIFGTLEHLKVKQKEQLQYQNLFKDMFDVSTKQFSNQITFKSNIDPNVLNKNNISKFQERIQSITKIIQQEQQNLKNIILTTNLSTIIFDRLKQNKTQNLIVKAISKCSQLLLSVKKQLQNQIKNKLLNPLNYVHIYSNKILNIENTVQNQLAELSQFQLQSKNKGILAQLLSAHKLMEAVKIWLIAKGFTSSFTSFYAVVDQHKWLIGFQINKTSNDKKKVKQFLYYVLQKYWFLKSKKKQQWQNGFDFFYSQYLEKSISINQLQNGVEYMLDFGAMLKQLSIDVRKDLAQVVDVYQFTHYYNIHRFNENPKSIQKMKEHHSSIVKRVLIKLNQLSVKEAIQSVELDGFNQLEMCNEVLALMMQLDLQKSNIQKIIKQTELIKFKQTDLNQFTEWFKNIAVKYLGFQYFQVKSSEGKIITILPTSKQEKYRLKSKKQIETAITQLNLPNTYHIKQENGISVIYLQNQHVTCILQDKSGYLKETAQLSNFQPEIPETQMLLLAYYQLEQSEITPLYIGQIKLNSTCNISISESNTIANISCAIWKINKIDYTHYQEHNKIYTKQSLQQLRNKLKSAASVQQRKNGIKIGEIIHFPEVGTWLGVELKNHHKRVEEKQKAEQERKRLQELRIKESEMFLKSISEQLIKEDLPSLGFVLKDIQLIQGRRITNKKEELTSYYRAVFQKTAKIIQTITENKTQQELNRINNVAILYLKGLIEKLVVCSTIQKKMIKAADNKFKILQAKIQKDKQEKKIKKIQQRKQKKQQERLKILEQNKIKQKQKIEKINSLNIANPATAEKQHETNPKIDYDNIDVPQTVNKPDLNQQVNVQSEKTSQNQPQFKIEDLLLEDDELQKLSQIKQQQYSIYFMQFLQMKQPKKIDYYKCILAQFWALKSQQRQTLVLLH